MAFKFPNNLPSPEYSTFEEWSDFIEICAIKEGQQNLFQLFKQSKLISDEILTEGIDSEEDSYDSLSDEIWQEIERRKYLLNDRYPFEVISKGTLKFKDYKNYHSDIYKYLLLTTIMDMRPRNSIISGLNPTLLFENLCIYSAKGYFGKDFSCKVFGTGQKGSFYQKIEEFIREIGEGGSARTHPQAKPKDDGVDIILFKNFRDFKESKFIAFGQCKTGTDWMDSIAKLNPDSFCKKWLNVSPLFTPIKMLFLSQYFPYRDRSYKGYETGLIFDRIRIMECLPDTITDVNEELISDIRKWSSEIILKVSK